MTALFAACPCSDPIGGINILLEHLAGKRSNPQQHKVRLTGNLCNLSKVQSTGVDRLD